MPVGRGPNNDVWLSVARYSYHAESVTAVKSHIYVYSPWVYPGGFSYAFVIMGNSAYWDYAQIGNYEAAGDDRAAAIQWGTGVPPAHQMNLAPRPLGTTPLFTVRRSGSTFLFKVGTATKMTVDLAWTPTVGEIASEVHNNATQLMGDSGEHENFNTNSIAINGGVWQTFDGTLLSYDTSWYGESGSNASFDTWDKTC